MNLPQYSLSMAFQERRFGVEDTDVSIFMKGQNISISFKCFFIFIIMQYNLYGISREQDEKYNI
jgi:hypothetical protein